MIDWMFGRSSSIGTWAPADLVTGELATLALDLVLPPDVVDAAADRLRALARARLPADPGDAPPGPGDAGRAAWASMMLATNAELCPEIARPGEVSEWSTLGQGAYGDVYATLFLGRLPPADREPPVLSFKELRRLAARLAKRARGTPSPAQEAILHALEACSREVAAEVKGTEAALEQRLLALSDRIQLPPMNTVWRTLPLLVWTYTTAGLAPPVLPEEERPGLPAIAALERRTWDELAAQGVPEAPYAARIEAMWNALLEVVLLEARAAWKRTGPDGEQHLDVARTYGLVLGYLRRMRHPGVRYNLNYVRKMVRRDCRLRRRSGLPVADLAVPGEDAPDPLWEVPATAPRALTPGEGQAAETFIALLDSRRPRDAALLLLSKAEVPGATRHLWSELARFRQVETAGRKELEERLVAGETNVPRNAATVVVGLLHPLVLHAAPLHTP